MSSPAQLRIYPCPADPCTCYSISLTSAIDHLSTAHPVFHGALQRNFGPSSLTLFISPVDLIPARLPSAGTVVLCLRCQTTHPTAAAANTHVATSPAHATSAALDRARYGPAASRCHMPLMQTVTASNRTPGVSPTQHNFIYESNPDLVVDTCTALTHPAQQLDTVAADTDRVLFRALVGAGGAVLTVPRDTAWAELPALLSAREPSVDWAVLVRAEGM